MALDAEQIIKRVFNSTKLALKATDEGAATAPKPANNLSAKQILKRVFDATAVALKLTKV